MGGGAPEPDFVALHRKALDEGREHYLDPATGYRVFTERFHSRRGTCCASGCRHCPFAHARVPSAHRRPRAWAPTLLSWGRDLPEEVEVIAFSGGKDSFLLAHRALAAGGAPVLLTVYDPATDRVPVQGASVAEIAALAESMGAVLLLAPLGREDGSTAAFVEGLEALGRSAVVTRLSFGDLHLEDVRAAREASLGPWAAAHGVSLEFPLFGRPLEVHLEEIFASGADIVVSASELPGALVGRRFDRAFVASLPEGVDPAGERGEFHTRVSAP